MIMSGDLKKIQDAINPVLESMGARIKKLEDQIAALDKKPASRSSSKASEG